MRLVMFVLVIALANTALAKPKESVEPPPLVRTNIAPPPIITPAAPAPTWSFSRWAASDYGSFTMASTLNESRSAFGIVCGQECVWFVNFQTDCTQGHQYPAMINSPAGSYPIILKCYHLSDRRLLTFSMTETSLALLDKPGEAGFAFPLEGGKFQVSRFSLSGGTQAIEKAMRIAIDRRNSNQEGLRDFTI